MRVKNKDYLTEEEGDLFLRKEYRPALENHVMLLDRIVSKFKINEWRDRHEKERANRATTTTARAYNSGTKMGILHMFLDNASTLSGLMDKARQFDDNNITSIIQTQKEQQKQKKKQMSKEQFYRAVVGKPKAQKEAQMLQDNIKDLAQAVAEATGEEKAKLQAQLDTMVGRLQEISSLYQLFDTVDPKTLDVEKALEVGEQEAAKEAAKAKEVKKEFQRNVVNYRKARVHVRELEGTAKKIARAFAETSDPKEQASLRKQLDETISKISEEGSSGGFQVSDYNYDIMDPEKAVESAVQEIKEEAARRESFVRDVIEAPKIRQQVALLEDNIKDLNAAMEAAGDENRPEKLQQLIDISSHLSETAGANYEAIDIDLVQQAQESVSNAVVHTYQTMVSLKVASDVGDLSGSELRDAVFKKLESGNLLGEFNQQMTTLIDDASTKRQELQKLILDLGSLYEDTCPAFDDKEAMGTWANGLYYASTAADGVAMVAGLGGPVTELAGEGFAAGVETAYDMAVMNQDIYNTVTEGIESWNSVAGDGTAKQVALVMSDPRVQAKMKELSDLQTKIKQTKTAAASAAVLDKENSNVYKAAEVAMDQVVSQLYNDGSPLPVMDNEALKTVPLAQAAVEMYDQLVSETGIENAKTAENLFR